MLWEYLGIPLGWTQGSLEQNLLTCELTLGRTVFMSDSEGMPNEVNYRRTCEPVIIDVYHPDRYKQIVSPSSYRKLTQQSGLITAELVHM